MSAREAPREHHIEVVRRARYWMLGDPSMPAAELWIVCHGYRQLAGRFLRRFLPLAGEGRLIVAPEALSRFYVDDSGGPHGPEDRVGASWMTREDRLSEIADYVDYLDRLCIFLLGDGATSGSAAPARPRVFVLGFSQGAATASRWAALGRAPLDRLVLWAGAVAHDLDLDAAAPRLHPLRPILVVGERDLLVPEEAVNRERDRLRRHGIDPIVFRHAGEHRIDAGALREVERRLREDAAGAGAADPAESEPHVP